MRSEEQLSHSSLWAAASASTSKDEAIEDLSLDLSSRSLKALMYDKTGSTMNGVLPEAGDGELPRESVGRRAYL